MRCRRHVGRHELPALPGRCRRALAALLRRVQVAGRRPRRPSGRGQVRRLPVPDAFRRRGPAVRPLHAEQLGEPERQHEPRGPPVDQRRRHDLQRARPRLPAVHPPPARADHQLRRRHRRRGPRAGRPERRRELPGAPADQLGLRHRLEPDDQHGHLLRSDQRFRRLRRRRLRPRRVRWRRWRRLHAHLGVPGLQLPRGVGVGHVRHGDARQRRGAVLRRPDLLLPPGEGHDTAHRAHERRCDGHVGQHRAAHLVGLDGQRRGAGLRHLPQRHLRRHGRRLDDQLHRHPGDAVDHLPVHGRRLRRLEQRVPAEHGGRRHDPGATHHADAHPVSVVHHDHGRPAGTVGRR